VSPPAFGPIPGEDVILKGSTLTSRNTH
jgi:hypothetical protein